MVATKQNWSTFNTTVFFNALIVERFKTSSWSIERLKRYTETRNTNIAPRTLCGSILNSSSVMFPADLNASQLAEPLLT